MADYADGGLAEEAVRVCEYYLGAPERREGARGTSKERAVWRCPECGGDFVARTGSAGCTETGCAALRNEDALGLVALHEGIDRRKDPRRLLTRCREVVEARRATEAAEAEDDRTARAGTHTGGSARVEDGAHAQPSDAPKPEIDGRPDLAAEKDGGRAVRAAERVKELREVEQYRRWKREQEREELERQEAERNEALEREAAETSRRLQERACAATTWATPGELARAVAYGLAAAVCLWVALTGVEAACAWLDALGPGEADYEVVERTTVGYGEAAPQAFLWERCIEALREHHRLLLGIATQVLFSVVLQLLWSSERRRRYAFGENEYLELNVVRRG